MFESGGERPEAAGLSGRFPGVESDDPVRGDGLPADEVIEVAPAVAVPAFLLNAAPLGDGRAEDLAFVQDAGPGGVEAEDKRGA